MSRRHPTRSADQFSSTALEARRVPAASATMSGTTLVVTGSDSPETIHVGGLNTGNIAVQFNNGPSRVFTGVQNIKIDAKGGDDTVNVNAAVVGDLEVKGGSGIDYLDMSGQYGDDVSVDLGSNRGEVSVINATVRDVSIGDDLTIKASHVVVTAKDYLWFQNYVRVGDLATITVPSVPHAVVTLDGHFGNAFNLGRLKINSAATRTEVNLRLVGVNTTTEINTGSGDDTVNLDYVHGGTSIAVKTNSGNDRVFISRSHALSLTADGGKGSDFLYQFNSPFSTRTITKFELFGI